MLVQSDLRKLNLASYPRALALIFSLLLHGLIIGGIESGVFTRKDRDIDEETQLRLAELKRQLEEVEREVPLIFVQVDPAQATETPPEDAKYYSALSSRAANPDTSRDELIPRIEGAQDKVAKTKDTPRSEVQPLQPAPPPPKPVEPEPDRAPQPSARPGDLALPMSPEQQAKEALRELQTPSRPRTLAQARQQRGLAGEKMKQEGGVRRFALEASLDVRATPFGAYDAVIIAAIQKRWYDLLDERPHLVGYTGKVVLEFRLNSNGHVSDMRVSEYSVTEMLALICQRAVQDPAPFPPWPDDLKRLVGKDHREVRFTFYYN
jgi:outer membrane biosynthesis protein TonB